MGGDAGLGAVYVEVTLVVHGFLERLVFPAEDVITMGSRSTGVSVSDEVSKGVSYLPKVHAVDEWVRLVRWPGVLVGLE